MPSPLRFRVDKFGGTSVATPERIRRVVALVQAVAAPIRQVVVVSALGGVTDRLLAAIDAALARSGEHQEILAEIRARHTEALQALALPEEQAPLQAQLDLPFHALAELLDGISLLRECTGRTRDAVTGMGERLSAPLVAAAFRSAGTPALALDATELIRTDDTFGEAQVRFEETNTLIQFRFQNLPAEQVAVVTGFIAATSRGVSTTLGRSGSDYTATLLGAALDAQEVVIWTDVDGVLSADPRLVPDAFTLPELSYREAAEMAYFGAKVLHPRTMRPLVAHNIPLYIRNTLRPEATGTRITAASSETEGHVKAVSTIRDVAVVMLEGPGLQGVPGISGRTFGALAQRSINVLMIAQASSEQSICMVVRGTDAEPAVAALRAAFEMEVERGDVAQVTVQPKAAIVSVVGDYMRTQPGLAGRMFATLGQARINVLAIAQGAAETNISAVVEDADVAQAVRALHEAFAAVHRRAHVFVLGVGGVGRVLLRLLEQQAPALLDDLNVKLRLTGGATSRRGVFTPDGLAPAALSGALAEATDTADEALQRFLDTHLERRILVDATANTAVARQYGTWLAQGISVVTPNKLANTFEHAYYANLQRLAQHSGAAYFYETTVGAALPVLSTLRDLRRSGDRITRIEGVLSGTLAFVFSALADGRTFSEAVHEARAQGFTEPDPRDDLGGEDVARKLLILAREAGLAAERRDITVDSLVPAALAEASVTDFLAGLADYDAAWQARAQAATEAGGRLQYIALLEGDRMRVAVQTVGADSPFARLQGTDNMVIFTTGRYAAHPLVITGAGAGPEVTAAGVLADVVHAALGER